MFNILPDNIKEEIRTEYTLRFWILASVCFVAVQISAILFLSPSIIISMYKEKDLQSSMETITQPMPAARNGSVANNIPSINNLLSSIDKTFTRPPVGLFLDAVLSRKTDAIHLTEFAYTSDKAGVHISIRGISDTRESLVVFAKSLQDLEIFKSVDLPVSNLAKDKNIDFSITVNVS